MYNKAFLRNRFKWGKISHPENDGVNRLQFGLPLVAAGISTIVVIAILLSFWLSNY